MQTHTYATRIEIEMNLVCAFEWLHLSNNIATLLWHLCFRFIPVLHFFSRASVFLSLYSKRCVFIFVFFYLSMCFSLFFLSFACTFFHARARLSMTCIYAGGKNSQWWPSFIWPKLRMSMWFGPMQLSWNVKFLLSLPILFMSRHGLTLKTELC